MNIDITSYIGIDRGEIINYNEIKDVLINRRIKLPKDIQCIYKISLEITPTINNTINIIEGVNLENKSLKGLLGDFILNVKCIIEYSRNDSSIGVESLEFIEIQYFPISNYVNKDGIMGKIRNIFLCKCNEDEVYLSIYYNLVV